MATSFFGNARKYEYNYYCGLTPKDLKRIGFWGYWRVAIFLFAILFFWIFCGWLADYSLPFGEVSQILASCFSGGMPERFIKFQSEFQREDISNFTSQDVVKSYSKAQVSLGILSRLNLENPEARIRAGSTAVKIKLKQGEIDKLSKQHPRSRSRHFCQLQKSFSKLFESGLSRDYTQLSLVLKEIEDISLQVKDLRLSKDFAVKKIQQQINAAKNQFDPIRFDILLNLESSIDNFLALDFQSNPQQNSLDKRLNEVIDQRDRLSQYIDRLQLENRQLSSDLNYYKKTVKDLEDKIKILSLSLKKAESEIKRLDISQGEALDRVGEEKRVNRILTEEKDRLIRKVRELENAIEKKRKESVELNKKLNELVEKSFSGMSPGKKLRALEGRFIGNIANPGSKFHFDFDCPHYWSYVGQYLYSSDPRSNSILTCDNSSRLEHAGLQACIICSRNSHL